MKHETADVSPNGSPVLQPGWHFRVTRSYGIKGTATYPDNRQVPFHTFQMITVDQKITRTDGKDILEAVREIIEARLHVLDIDQSMMVPTDLAGPGTRFIVSHHSQGSTLFDQTSDSRILDTAMVDAFSPTKIQALWPLGRLKAGQHWSSSVSRNWQTAYGS
ncbi:MAG TPA: hypothetical protein EYP57_08635 [Thermodesulfobacteriaceae bacterium]|nr:hypothetical protein [Thermodesulfobacteriaceae bacterium]